MPVRSLNSSVFKCPDLQTVHAAVMDWTEQAINKYPEIQQVGYIGSYARSDWGVGSDLDLIVIIAAEELPRWERTSRFDLAGLPVPTDMLVYTRREWQKLKLQETLFSRTVKKETVWLYES